MPGFEVKHAEETTTTIRTSCRPTCVSLSRQLLEINEITRNNRINLPLWLIALARRPAGGMKCCCFRRTRSLNHLWKSFLKHQTSYLSRLQSIFENKSEKRRKRLTLITETRFVRETWSVSFKSLINEQEMLEKKLFYVVLPLALSLSPPLELWILRTRVLSCLTKSNWRQCKTCASLKKREKSN